AIGSEFNTIRAYFKSPLDPEYAANLRKQAREFVTGIGAMLQGQIDGVVARGENLIDYVETNGNQILKQVAQQEEALRSKLNAAADQAKKAVNEKVGQGADAARGAIKGAHEQLDSVSQRIADLEQKARDQATRLK